VPGTEGGNGEQGKGGPPPLQTGPVGLERQGEAGGKPGGGYGGRGGNARTQQGVAATGTEQHMKNWKKRQLKEKLRGMNQGTSSRRGATGGAVAMAAMAAMAAGGKAPKKSDSDEEFDDLADASESSEEETVDAARERRLRERAAKKKRMAELKPASQYDGSGFLGSILGDIQSVEAEQRERAEREQGEGEARKASIEAGLQAKVAMLDIDSGDDAVMDAFMAEMEEATPLQCTVTPTPPH